MHLLFTVFPRPVLYLVNRPSLLSFVPSCLVLRQATAASFVFTLPLDRVGCSTKVVLLGGLRPCITATIRLPNLEFSFPNPSISFPIGSCGEELGLLTGRSFGLRTAGSELALGLPSCPAESLFFIPIAAACYSRLFSLEVGCLSQDSHPPRTSTLSRTAGHELLTTLTGVLYTSTGSPSASAHDRLR